MTPGVDGLVMVDRRTTGPPGPTSATISFEKRVAARVGGAGRKKRGRTRRCGLVLLMSGARGAAGLVAVAATAAPAAAAAVAAAATAAAATAVPAAATAAAAATATGAVFAGLGLVDGEVTPVDFLPVQGGDGGLGLLVAAHLDEPESLAAAGVPVLDHLGALHGAVLRAQLLEVRAGRVVAEVPDVQLAAHLKLLSLLGPVRTRRLLSGFAFERGRRFGPEGRRVKWRQAVRTYEGPANRRTQSENLPKDIR